MPWQLCRTTHIAASIPQDDDWGASAFPFVPGHEVVGEVVARGPGVTKFAVGERVGVGWIKAACGGCLHCLRGEENICVKGYTGLITMGARARAPTARFLPEFPAAAAVGALPPTPTRPSIASPHRWLAASKPPNLQNPRPPKQAAWAASSR